MGASEYEDMRNSIVQGVDNVLSAAGSGDVGRANRMAVVAKIRYSLRRTFHTMPEELIQQHSELHSDSLTNLLRPVTEMASRYGELFVAMANGPYMLLMRADNPEQFLQYSKRHHRHKVEIHYENDSSPWSINPTNEPGAYRLTFNLPSHIRDWIFSATLNTRRRAVQIKKQILSSITIYRSEEDQDHLFRLEFDPESVDFENEILDHNLFPGTE